MKKKKTNPRKLVISKYDVKKAVEQELQERIERGKLEALNSLLVAFVGIPLLAANDTFDMGPTRLKRFLRRMLTLYRDWNNGEYTDNDIIEWINDYLKTDIIKELGVKL